MRKDKKILLEIRKNRLISLLSEVVYGEGHPLEMRFLAAKKLLYVYGADRKTLKKILDRFSNVID